MPGVTVQMIYNISNDDGLRLVSVSGWSGQLYREAVVGAAVEGSGG
ncbi:MAG TPA: hypothetical protein VNY78_08830 [Edaphobacter sp.]|nr:hypothetical protein [Edaphobacter sp.]